MTHIDNNSENPPLAQPIERGLSGNIIYKLGMLLTRCLVKFEAKGLENIPQDSPYVLAVNHETFVDAMWVSSYLPKAHFPNFACMAAQDLLTDYGWFGKVIMKVGRGIPLNRHGNPIRGLILAKKQVEEGNILLVHPEGTRSHDGRLGQIHEGATFIAMKANVPLIPVFIDGAFEIFSRYHKWPATWDKKRRRRRRLVIHYGPPLYPENYKNSKAMTVDMKDWLENAFANKLVTRDFDEVEKMIAQAETRKDKNK